MKRGYDLHTHSNVSDGILTPTKVVEAAVEADLAGIALTDHDSTAGLPEAVEAGERLGLEVFMGCELSAQQDGQSVHVLAYFVDPLHEAWSEELRWIRDDRLVRAEKIVEKLRDAGVEITMEMVKRASGGESIGRPHIAAAMVEAGVIEETPQAFTKEWIADDGACYEGKQVLDPVRSIELIRDAGGAAVLAHPIWLGKHGLNAEAVIESCAQVGLAGLEVYHPEHSPAEEDRFSQIAADLGLLETGSSDFHGNKHGGPIGMKRTRLATVDALRDRAAR